MRREIGSAWQRGTRWCGPRRSLALVAIAAVTAGVAAAAAQQRVGGKDIRTAPVVRLGTRFQPGNLTVAGGKYFGNPAEYFKASFAAGVHVKLRVESTGARAPCVDFLKRGTDDFNLNDDSHLKAEYNENGNRGQLEFVASQGGTYPFVFYGCAGAEKWPYRFSVLAPHALRLVMPELTRIGDGTKLAVRVLDAFSEPVTAPRLRLTLFGFWGGGPPRRLGSASPRTGTAKFTLDLPASIRGKRIRLIVSGGDDVRWVSTSAGRRYVVR